MSCDQGNAESNEGPSGTTNSSEDDDQEESTSSNLNTGCVNGRLEKFRQQWQRELHVSPKHTKEDSQKNVQEQLDDRNEDIETEAKVLFLYGVEHELKGKLYEAMQFYRRAVQLVPDIELKLYETSSNIPKQKKVTANSSDEFKELSLNKMDSDDDGVDDTDLYTRFLHKYKHHAVCLPQYEQKCTHLSSLPTEIILYILRWVVSSDLDLRSLEFCALVCRGFYLCCRDSEIWKLACARVWGVNCGEKSDPYLSWRNMYIERSRLKFNGCYISKTTYFRHGENSFQDQYYRPWHLVEYYRYLRFFPEGRVLMLTTPEEPVQSVGHLKYRNPRHVGVLTGHYRLRDNTVTLLVQRQHKLSCGNYKTHGRRRDMSNDDYLEQTFNLELLIQNHHRRKHVQLSWLRYSVKSNETENVTTFELAGNRFPPLWFSRVKSYTAESEAALQ